MTICSLANPLGSAIGSLIPAMLVKQDEGSDAVEGVPVLLLVQLVVAGGCLGTVYLVKVFEYNSSVTLKIMFVLLFYPHCRDSKASPAYLRVKLQQHWTKTHLVSSAKTAYCHHTSLALSNTFSSFW